MEKKIILKNNISLEELINQKPIKTLEFIPFVPEVEGKLIANLSTKIILYPNLLEYFTNYVIENEFKWEADEQNFNEESEVKKLKCEDQGIFPKDKLTIARIAENIPNPPEKGGTDILYKITIDCNSIFVNFNLNSKKEQISIYNDLIKWLYE